MTAIYDGCLLGLSHHRSLGKGEVWPPSVGSERTLMCQCGQYLVSTSEHWHPTNWAPHAIMECHTVRRCTRRAL